MASINPSDPVNIWGPFRYFLGDWNGTGSGKPGLSTVERSYRLTLADQFIEVNNRSDYPPQENNPAGEIHEDLALLGYDKERALYVMREFHVEGFVLQYVLETFADVRPPFVFVTESIENIPAGWRARTTLEMISENSFRETFELAGPDQAWECYIINELSRA